MDVLPDLRAAARISGWRGGSGHRAHGGAIHLSEVRQGQEHEPAQVAFVHPTHRFGRGNARWAMAGAVSDAWTPGCGASCSPARTGQFAIVGSGAVR